MQKNENTVKTFDRLIAICQAQNASDIHFSVGQHPICRINGELVRLERLGTFTNSDIKQFVEATVPDIKLKEMEADKQTDYAYQTEDGIRLRCNAFMQQETYALAVRILSNKKCTVNSLGLPEVLYKICDSSSGLVLVTGPTGSGKSTTLSAMIRYINENRSCHILTIEDPIEYKHTSVKALVNQREVGADAVSFGTALKGALRQDPDVILIGEMRDLESIAIAVTAAETGHLVFGTLHTLGAAQTIDRLIDVFPADQQQQIRVQLSGALKAVISQRLVQSSDRKQRVPVNEIMLVTDAIANNIREGKTAAIHNAIATGAKIGMVSFELSLFGLVKKGVISKEKAFETANDPGTLESLFES